MRLIKPYFIIEAVMLPGLGDGERPESDSLMIIEKAGRTCYKSESDLCRKTSEEFTAKILKLGHESVLEHSAMTVRFICDRGVSHELVRHRLAAFSQESTRYCNYGKEGQVTFIIPSWIEMKEGIVDKYYYTELGYPPNRWINSLLRAEESYLQLLKEGWTPQQARSVLPNSLKTEIVMTTNFREWRHIFRLRTSASAHPQMRELMIPLLTECKKRIPVVFDDIKEN